MLTYDENGNHLEPVVYNPKWTIDENLERHGELSWHRGWCEALATISYKPGYEPPAVLVEKSATLTQVIAQELWVEYGRSPEDGDLKKEKIRELFKENFEVR
jgi:hypothetical protein